MKRNVPLLITALGGFVLIIAYFIPATQGWGEVAAIWFDVLASIAFVLGGGNLLKIHLKNISDRKIGWAYSAITLAAFFITLLVGLGKVGVIQILNIQTMPCQVIIEKLGALSGGFMNMHSNHSLQQCLLCLPSIFLPLHFGHFVLKTWKPSCY